MRLLRPSLLYGKHGRLGVGRTKFFEDYVHRNDGAVEQFIAGTSVRRLKLVKIGQRAVAAISDEVDRLDRGAAGRAGCTVKRQEGAFAAHFGWQASALNRITSNSSPDGKFDERFMDAE